MLVSCGSGLELKFVRERRKQELKPISSRVVDFKYEHITALGELFHIT